MLYSNKAYTLSALRTGGVPQCPPWQLCKQHAVEGKKYSYDSMGNITMISQSTGSYYPLIAYEYDSQNQLIKETYYDGKGTGSAHVTDTYEYTYDTAGNILSEKKNGTVTKTYTYGDSQWKDLLTAVNGQTITYDATGNPTTYNNGNTELSMDWVNGRQLSYIGCYEEHRQVAYSYDVDGIRTQKYDDGVRHKYITQNGKVVRETIGSGSTAKVLDFIYDESGRPFALKYSTNGGSSFTTYYYILNLQGDVVKLVEILADDTGIWSYGEIANYEYDAWGRILSVTDERGNAITDFTHIAHLNPLRYRGYYYDVETQFYYLQSRYYDPANHRFINADSYASTGQGFLGYNMFAYCRNNPVCLVDPRGYGAFSNIFKLLKSLFGGETNEFCDNSEVVITVGPSSVIIDAYLAVSGDIPTETLTNGIKDYWEGEYELFGKTRTVTVNTCLEETTDHRAIRVHSYNENGRSNTISTWGGSAETTIQIFARYEKGAKKNIGWSMAHEFGHALGVKDYYTYVNAGVPGYSSYYKSIMNRVGMHAEPDDIIKVIFASAFGSAQDWYGTEG